MSDEDPTEEIARNNIGASRKTYVQVVTALSGSDISIRPAIKTPLRVDIERDADGQEKHRNCRAASVA